MASVPAATTGWAQNAGRTDRRYPQTDGRQSRAEDVGSGGAAGARDVSGHARSVRREGRRDRQGGWGADGKKRSKKANGRLLDGRTWDDMPELSSHV